MTVVAPAPAPSKTDRPARLVPWVVLALWIVALAVAGPLAGELSGVQRNDAVDYLPASADSTRVAELEARLPGGESTDLLVVHHRDSGLTAADRTAAADQVADIAARYRLTARPSPVLSADGTTLLYPVTSTTPDTDEARTEFVEGVRAIADGAEVGGPGAYDVDTAEVFESLDGPLLYTTIAVVAILLILIYRSPVLWLVPLLAAGAADALAMAVAYGLNQGFGLAVSGQSSGIMTVLVFGVGTDYALLLVARYREELFVVERPYDAMVVALRKSGPAILASAATVAAGVLCLLAADLNSSRGVGPAGAAGVLSALLAMGTLLPAVLVLLGRRVFWPFAPVVGAAPGDRRSLFARLGAVVDRRPATVLISGVLVLGVLALGTLNLPGSLRQAESFTSTPESTAAGRTLAAAFPGSGNQPITVLTPTARAASSMDSARAVDGVVTVTPGRATAEWAEFSVTAGAEPESPAEEATIVALRRALDGAYVGGPSAQQLDLRTTNARDRLVVIPLVLAVVLLVLIVLLRSLVAPLLLTAAVIAVWGAALGLGGLVFSPLLGYSGTDPGLALLSFVFLVALGVDYGIFLMHRMRQAALDGDDPRQATLGALRATGGVITSAGLVLTATFAVLLNMPMVQLAELGFVIAAGVLLDTFLVRTFLVTSVSLLLRRALWWPGSLSRVQD